MAQGTFPANFGASRTPGLMTVVYFTEDGTFDKADYPGAQSVRVTAVGGGGGGAVAVYNRSAGGGAGGTCAVSHISIASLETSTTVTVGAGGAGANTGGSSVNTSGSNAGDSSFGDHVLAQGGRGGFGSDNTGGTALSLNSIGQMIFVGGDGSNGSHTDGVAGGSGGSSYLGGGGRGGRPQGNSAIDGNNYGGGGGGGTSSDSYAYPGGDGADGIVIVEVYSTYAGGDTSDLATRDYVDEIGELGHAETVIASNESFSSTTDTDFPGLTKTVEVGHRPIKVTIQSTLQLTSANVAAPVFSLWQDGVKVRDAHAGAMETTWGFMNFHHEFRLAPAPGEYTYTVKIRLVNATDRSIAYAQGTVHSLNISAV